MSIDILNIIEKSYSNAFNYFEKIVLNPFPEGKINGFYFLIFISLIIWGFEIVIPWRKKQAVFRKDFWIDAFYMFFNFYFFNLLLFAALSNVTLAFFKEALKPLGYEGGHLIDFSEISWAWQLVIFFFIADFVQWCIHYMLHHVPFMWKFHKVHHSVTEMGFAAHLRYHFLETFVYQSIKYITLSMLFGFHLEQAFIVYSLTVLIGHLNHANLNIDYGPLKYILNNPKMHIWHHAKELPKNRPNGMNYGISLSIWDYIFRTNYIPSDGRDIELGFEKIEKYPSNFFRQLIEPFKKEK